jgi:hypothetical protein
MEQKLLIKKLAPATRQFDADTMQLVRWLTNHTAPKATLVHASVTRQYITLFVLAYAQRSVTYNDEFLGALSFDAPEGFSRWSQKMQRFQQVFDTQGSCSPQEILQVSSQWPVTHVICERKTLSPASEKALMTQSRWKIAYQNQTYWLITKPLNQ